MIDYTSHYAKMFNTPAYNVGYYRDLDHRTQAQVVARFGRYGCTDYVYHLGSVDGERTVVARRKLEPGDRG